LYILISFYLYISYLTNTEIILYQCVVNILMCTYTRFHVVSMYSSRKLDIRILRFKGWVINSSAVADRKNIASANILAVLTITGMLGNKALYCFCMCMNEGVIIMSK
jgi:hypothetical protein